jgi:hypothetical protein
MIAGVIGLSLVWGFDSWWKGEAHSFHFLREGWFDDYSLGMDKVGHTYTSYFFFHSFRNIMLWGGFEPSTALWWGVGTSSFLAFCMEVGDGFSNFGFSYEDLSANLMGVGYGVLQTQMPFLRNFCLKWSYVPNRRHVSANRFTRHYDVHTYWLTFNMHNLLPQPLKDHWPEFLQLAVGYGVNEDMTRREGVIGLDFNLEVIPAPSVDVLLLQKSVNMIHIPAPAIKFTQGKEPRYYLFHIN